MLDLNTEQLNKLAAMPTEHSWMARWFALPGWAQNKVEEKVADWVQTKKRELPSGFLAIRMAAYLLEYQALQMLRESDYRIMYRVPEVNDVEEAIDLANQDDHMMTKRDKESLRLSLENLVNGGLEPEPSLISEVEEEVADLLSPEEYQKAMYRAEMNLQRQQGLPTSQPSEEN